MKQLYKKLQYGMTLIELSVVLLILVALAGLAIPYISGTGQTAMCQTTDATMQAVKEAIMGGAAGNGYYADTLGHYPAPKNTPYDYSLRYLFETGGWQQYNPQTGVGWRGPYLMTGGQLDATAAGNLHSSFSNQLDINPDPPAGNVHVDHRAEGNTQVFDAWHRPIVLQVPYYDDGGGKAYHPEYARLVSAGPGNGIEPGDAALHTPIAEYDAASREDDRVLFLYGPDPKAGGNTPCN